MKKLRRVSGDQEMPLDTGGGANFWLTFGARYVWGQGDRQSNNRISLRKLHRCCAGGPFIAVTFTPIGATCGRTGTTGLLKLSTRPTGLSMQSPRCQQVRNPVRPLGRNSSRRLFRADCYKTVRFRTLPGTFRQKRQPKRLDAEASVRHDD